MTVFYLRDYPQFCLHNGGWRNAQPEDVAVLLNNVLEHFHKSIDCRQLGIFPVHIKHVSMHTGTIEYPIIYRYAGHIEIFLAVSDSYWSRYVYQFSHELCHHLIGIYQQYSCDKFGWFEESLCEMASLYTLYKMAIAWENHAPYASWNTFGLHLKAYADDILTQTELSLASHFTEWLIESLPCLYKNRYQREKNTVIAARLLPFFLDDPNLWKLVQHMKSIIVTEDMEWTCYLEQWRQCLPDHLTEKLDVLKKLLL